MPDGAFQGGMNMRIHDSMLEINTRLQRNPHANQNNQSRAASPNAPEFSEHLKKIQANPSASCQLTEGNIANVVWIKVPFLPRPERIKAGAYQALSEI